jgi:hypothetical protein
MLRPLLEQAADPIHMHQNGQAQSFLNRVSNNVSSTNTSGSTATASAKQAKTEIPVSVTFFKPSNVRKSILKMI